MSKRAKSLNTANSRKSLSWETQILIALLACCITACSGSSAPPPDDGQNSPESTAPPRDITAINGSILIQESNGKRVFDAFFSEKPRTDEPETPLWVDGNRACYTSVTSQETAAPEGVTPITSATFLAGSAINFQDRTGNFLSLEPQSLGTTVVYSSDSRWMDTELPQGTLLSVSGSNWFPDNVGIELFPLQQIELLEPENKMLLRQGTTIRWEAGNSNSDEIQLALSAPYEHNKTTDNETVRLNQVNCVLPDNGSFELPGKVRSAMGNPDTVYVSLSRRRASELVHQGSVLSVLQISHD